MVLKVGFAYSFADDRRVFARIGIFCPMHQARKEIGNQNRADSLHGDGGTHTLCACRTDLSRVEQCVCKMSRPAHCSARGFKRLAKTAKYHGAILRGLLQEAT